MNKLVGLLFLTLVSGCGEDVSSNRRLGENQIPTTDVNRPELCPEGGQNVRSHLHREKGSPVLSYAEEITKTLSNQLPDSLYRVIPAIGKDDEGSAKNVTTVADRGRPGMDCGLGTTFTGVEQRIADCAQKNSELAQWDGTRFGAAGEGTWNLVSKNATKEIWQDGRTGMIWSYVLNAPVNWCMASGNSESETTETIIDCTAIGGLQSVCAKASLEETGANVVWRLPTRNDFLQADLNGIRFVLKKENRELGLWTATIRSASEGRNEAWVYNSQEGTLSSGTLPTERNVRCIGAPVK